MRFYSITFIYLNKFIHSTSDLGNLEKKVSFFVELTTCHFQIISRLTVMIGFNIYSQNHKKFGDENQLLWNCIQTTKRQSCTIQYQNNLSHFYFLLKSKEKNVVFYKLNLLISAIHFTIVMQGGLNA